MNNPNTADDRAVHALSLSGAMCGEYCGDEPGDHNCPDCERVRRGYIADLRAAGWAPREEMPPVERAGEADVVPPPALTEEGRLRAQVELLTEAVERSDGLAQLGARCFRDHHDAQIAEAHAVTEGHRFALSVALGLGTGAPWEAIHERVAELRRVADEEHDTETQQPAPTSRLSGQHADALWDAIAPPGPDRPSYPVQHERVCRVVAAIIDELTPAPVGPPDRATVLREVAEQQEQTAVTDSIRRRRSIATARRLFAVELRRMADEEQPATEARPEVPVHACPGPDDNGISPCCRRPPFEFRGERLTRDPAAVTCPGLVTTKEA
ncbi:hypothetical protein [Streptomyces sp. NPDC057413]|uniref:hypothetical protein n=1 Tax=Streptomyces sp. NPDC057413 TaxID=3346124 RepID=UPI0036BD9A71